MDKKQYKDILIFGSQGLLSTVKVNSFKIKNAEPLELINTQLNTEENGRDKVYVTSQKVYRLLI